MEKIKNEKLTPIDSAKILELLEKESKMTVRQISEALGRTFNAVNDKMPQLKRAGTVGSREIIEGGTKKREFFLIKNSEKNELSDFPDNETVEILKFIKEKQGSNPFDISGALHLSYSRVKTRIFNLQLSDFIKKIKGAELKAKAAEVKFFVNANSSYFFTKEFLEGASTQDILGEIKERREEKHKKQLEKLEGKNNQ